MSDRLFNVLGVLFVLFDIAVVIAVTYVVIHFITKAW